MFTYMLSSTHSHLFSDKIWKHQQCFIHNEGNTPSCNVELYSAIAHCTNLLAKARQYEDPRQCQFAKSITYFCIIIRIIRIQVLDMFYYEFVFFAWCLCECLYWIVILVKELPELMHATNYQYSNAYVLKTNCIFLNSVYSKTSKTE